MQVSPNRVVRLGHKQVPFSRINVSSWQSQVLLTTTKFPMQAVHKFGEVHSWQY